MIRIEAHALGKQFPHRGPRPRFRWRDCFKRLRPHETPPPFWALRDVSFNVNAGETLGVVGRNGAGKSTLLWLLSGISQPSTGHVAIHGRIGALLELGGGFVDDLTGRENALLAGVSAGLTRREVRHRLDEIVAFAEIAEFMDAPVRTYSTGMRMRLAFSVAVHTEPNVLLVDEFLAVGDLAFQAKCRARIAQMRSGGCAVVLVSHGLGDVRETCDRVLWLREGCIAALDAPDVVTSLYETEMHQRTLELTPAPAPTRTSKSTRTRRRIGSRELEITHVALRSRPVMRSGGPFALELGYRGRAAARNPIFVVSITREDGVVCLDTNTETARVSTHGLPASGVIRFSIPRLELGAGRYFVDVGIFDANWAHAYDHHSRAQSFTIEGATALKGVLAPPTSWEAAPASTSSRLTSAPALTGEH